MNNIQDYILASSGDAQASTLPAIKKKTEVSYNIVAKTNTDVVIERSTSRSKQVLAIIPSKEQYYIQNKSECNQLTVDSMNKFLSDLTDPIEIELDWIGKIMKGKQYCEKLLNYVSFYRDQICAGLMTQDDWLKFLGRYSFNPSDIAVLHTVNPKLALFLNKKREQVEHRPPIGTGYHSFQPYACGAYEGRDHLLYLHFFSGIFGIDKTRLYVEKMIERDLNFEVTQERFLTLLSYVYPRIDGCYTQYYLGYGRKDPDFYDNLFSECQKTRNDVHLDADAFISYILSYQAEGCKGLHEFISYLADDWKMQIDLYGCIREKYPKNLSTHHDKLSLAHSFVKQKLDDAAFRSRVAQDLALEWSDSNYAIIAPKTIGDMVDEAQQQSNCLRSYIDRVIAGATKIFFLREKNRPEESLVTIEVKDGALVQVKGKYNKAPSYEQKKALSRWAQEKNLQYNF